MDGLVEHHGLRQSQFSDAVVVAVIDSASWGKSKREANQDPADQMTIAWSSAHVVVKQVAEIQGANEKGNIGKV